MRGVLLDMEGRMSLRMSSRTEMASSTVTLKPSFSPRWSEMKKEATSRVKKNRIGNRKLITWRSGLLFMVNWEDRFKGQKLLTDISRVKTPLQVSGIEKYKNVYACIYLLCTFSVHLSAFSWYLSPICVSPSVAYSVYELIPLFVFMGEIVAVDRQLKELPVSLSLHHLSGKLSGSRWVGERKEMNFIDCGERREGDFEIKWI